MSDLSMQVYNAIVEAASAPAVKASTAASGIVIGVDWMSSGPGLIAGIGLAFTACTFAVNLWATWRRDRREERIEALKAQRLQAGLPIPIGIESDRMELP